MAQPQSRQRPLPEHQQPHQRQQDELRQRQEQEGEGEQGRARLRNAMDRLRNATGALLPNGRHTPTATTAPASNERRAFHSPSPSPPSPPPADAQVDEEEPPESDAEEEGDTDTDSDVENVRVLDDVDDEAPAGARGTSGASNTLTSNASSGTPRPASVPATSSGSIDWLWKPIMCVSPTLSHFPLLPFLPSIFPPSIPYFPSSSFPSRLFVFIDPFSTASPREPRPPPAQTTCRPRLPPLLTVSSHR